MLAQDVNGPKPKDNPRIALAFEAVGMIGTCGCEQHLWHHEDLHRGKPDTWLAPRRTTSAHINEFALTRGCRPHMRSALQR